VQGQHFVEFVAQVVRSHSHTQSEKVPNEELYTNCRRNEILIA
jgi:hypothetical protein